MGSTAMEAETETKFERRNQTGLSDSTHTSSSSASEKYLLDEFDEAPILLYKYRGGLQTSSQKDLCKWLDKGMLPLRDLSVESETDMVSADNNFDRHRVTTKPIPRMTSFVDVRRSDLYLPDERDVYAQYPNFTSSLASVKIPRIPYWSRMVFGNYDQLYIVSTEGSPTSSQASGSTRNASPTNSWGIDSQLDARLGALRERHEGLPQE